MKNRSPILVTLHWRFLLTRFERLFALRPSIVVIGVVQGGRDLHRGSLLAGIADHQRDLPRGILEAAVGDGGR